MSDSGAPLSDGVIFLSHGQSPVRIMPNRREFFGQVGEGIGAAVLVGFVDAAAASKPAPLSTRIRDYPHIIDVIPSVDMHAYFPHFVEGAKAALSRNDLQLDYLVELAVSLVWHESRMERFAYSPAGAAGLSQLMEGTARDLGLVVEGNPALPDYLLAMKGSNEAQKAYDAAVQKLVQSAKAPHLDGRILISTAGLLREQDQALALSRSKVKTAWDAVKAYVDDLRHHPGTIEQRDQRFVPSYAIAAGIRHLATTLQQCVKHYGVSTDINVWRAIAAYNAGMRTTKEWYGFPNIPETVNHARRVILDLTDMMEIGRAYGAKDFKRVAEIKSRLNERNEYFLYQVRRGDTFSDITHHELERPYGLTQTQALEHIRTASGDTISNPAAFGTLHPGQMFRIYYPKK